MKGELKRKKKSVPVSALLSLFVYKAEMTEAHGGPRKSGGLVICTKLFIAIQLWSFF